MQLKIRIFTVAPQILDMNEPYMSDESQNPDLRGFILQSQDVFT